MSRPLDTQLCPHCGEAFSRLDTRTTFCSIACANTARSSRIELTCHYCKQSYTCPRYKVQTSRYCSMVCRRKDKDSLVVRICRQCGVEFHISAKKVAVCCSIACSNIARTSRVELTCEQCRNSYIAVRNHALHSRFCSHACAADNARRSEQRACGQCGALFIVLPSRPQRFCSQRCRGAYLSKPLTHVCEKCQTHYRPKVAHAATSRWCSQLCFRQSEGETSIERIVRESLILLGIAFVQEHPIAYFFVDFFLPSLNTVIEADGAYWHQSRQRQDAKRDAIIRKRAIVVIRITDTELTTAPAPEIVRQRLRAAGVY